MKYLKLLLVLSLGWVSVPALAADEIPADARRAIEAALKEALREGASYGDIEKAPIDGLYQVAVEGGGFLFLTGDGRYMISGELFANVDGSLVNLSDAQRKTLRQDLLGEIGEDDTIVFAAEGKRKAIINVFTDVDCGYCRKLHQEVPELNSKGVEVRYLAFPRAGLGSSGYDKLATAWCAADPQQTLTDLKSGQKVEINVCQDNPVAEGYLLGERMGVRGTPALVLMDGTMIPGYQPAPALLELLGID